MSAMIDQTIKITIANQLGGDFRLLILPHELEEESHRAMDWIRDNKLSHKAIMLMGQMLRNREVK